MALKHHYNNYNIICFPALLHTSIILLQRMRNGLIQTLEGSGGNGSESMKVSFH